MAAAELGSFSRAATRLSVSTPALVKQVSGFEAEYDERASVMDRLGQEVDVIQTSFSTLRWEGQCNLLPLFDAPFYLVVPRTNPLAGRDAVGLSDLMGQRVRILRHAHDDMDRLREALMANEGVHVADVEAFDIELFNDSMEKGDCVLTTGAWSGVHPGFVGVPLRWTPAPCYLVHPLQPKPQVRRFVGALARCVG